MVRPPAPPLVRPFIQIAGIHDPREAALIVESGATHLGFPLRLPVHAEDCSEAQAKSIIAGLPDSVVAVLITYLDSASEIIDFARELAVSCVQLHGPIDARQLEQLRSRVPSLHIIKSVVVGHRRARELMREVQQFDALVDAFITDTHDPASGADGATGQTHDWQFDRELVDQTERPVIMAGGLNPQNVEAAIQLAHPAGVDVHTGVEGPDGRKSPELVRTFVDNASKALSRHHAHTCSEQ